jgi:hypothetical protein
MGRGWNPDRFAPLVQKLRDNAMLAVLYALIMWVLVSLAMGLLMVVRTLPSKTFHINFRRIQLHAGPIRLEQEPHRRRAF